MTIGNALLLASADARNAYIQLLMHMDGANNGTTFTDEAGHSVTRVGSPVISTAQAKFSGASGLFNGSNQALAISGSTDFGIGLGDFTLDFWFYPSSTSFGRIFQLKDITTRNGFTILSNANSLSFNDGNGGVTASGVSINAWHWGCISRTFEGGTSRPLRLWLDGTYVGSINENGLDLGSSPYITIGAQTNNGSTYSAFYPGYIDEIRLDVGHSRYTSNRAIAVPTAPYTLGSP